MAHLLALDEGTTSARAIVFDESLAPVAIAQRAFEQRFPEPGWVEHDAEEIWAVQAAVATEALERAGLRAGDIAGVGITNQRETVVVWDRRTGRPIGPAIVWQDRRTAGECDRLRRSGVEALARARTGLLLDPYFSATKLAWMLEHSTGAMDLAHDGHLAFGTIDSWLLWKLTGGRVHATDATNASRTLLFDIHRGAWDDELLQAFGVPHGVLAQVVPTSGTVAEVSSLPALNGVPIAGLAGDQQAALFGQACFAPGLVKNTYGTGCFMLQNTGAEAVESGHRLLTTVAWRANGQTTYALEGSVFTAGAAIQWLRDGLGVIRRAEDIDALASSVPDSAGVVFVPALAGLGAPHWDPRARGTVVGITRDTTAAHLARAALEGIALEVADLIDAMSADTSRPTPELRVDGGAARCDMLMQLQADILGVPIVRPACTETTAMGAAALAGLGVGLWPDTEAIGAAWREERRFEPCASRDRVSALRERWGEAVERAKGWAS